MTHLPFANKSYHCKETDTIIDPRREICSTTEENAGIEAKKDNPSNIAAFSSPMVAMMSNGHQLSAAKTYSTLTRAGKLGGIVNAESLPYIVEDKEATVRYGRNRTVQNM